MKKLCIYHSNCADGFGAAWAVRHALGDDVEFYPGVYQQAPPDVTGRQVIMVDFSYKRPVLEKMAEQAQSILILDHHKSAAEDLAGFPEPPPEDTVIDGAVMRGWLPNAGIYARFDMERSGAMMAWDHFNHGRPPQLLMHIQDRDLWKFKLPYTREIQAAVFSYPYDFSVWDDLMAVSTAALKGEGEAIERKHFKDINEFIGAAKVYMSIWGHIIPALNAPYFWSSDAGHIMAQGEPFAACYWDTPDGRVFSLRSTDDGVDVSEIAKHYGGGGHRNAAGFKVDYNDPNMPNMYAK